MGVFVGCTLLFDDWLFMFVSLGLLVNLFGLHCLVLSCC